MIQLKSICDQVEKVAGFGYISFPFNVLLKEDDYERVWVENGGWIPSTSDEFTFYGLSGPVVFKKRMPDYIDGYTYYYFAERFAVSDYGMTYGHEIQIIRMDGYADWKRYDHEGKSILIPYFVKEKFEDFLKGIKKEDKKEEISCWHTNRYANYFSHVNACWICENCKKDLGLLTRDEFYANIKQYKGR